MRQTNPTGLFSREQIHHQHNHLQPKTPVAREYGSLMMYGVRVIQQREQLMARAYFLHFKLVPMLNRVLVLSPDLATTERVVAPVHPRWVSGRGAEKECVVQGILRK